MRQCDCADRVGIEINSFKLFEEFKRFFERQVQLGIFEDVKVEKPYYIGYDSNHKKYEWYADKWYQCKCCETLWEFAYPDFPANGFIRKYPKDFL
ncbi:MAG: hypothetical protein LIO58_07760 [Oscillospiraceae bacterium]|nr:hypothetical protein [Oscillospiraceae bacterium]